jgi:RNA polymerase sigma-70 factor (ECF subfamily)
MSKRVPPDFEQIYATFHPKVVRYIGRLTDADGAADIAQEVFLKVSRGLKDFRGDARISTWIYRIATNAVLDRVRASTHKHELRPLDDNAGDGDAIEDRCVKGEKREPLDLYLIRKEMNECIRNIILKLPDEHRAVIVLKDMEGFTNAEIADILRISIDNVKIRLHRARARLKKELGAQCIFYRDHRNELACDRKSIPLALRSKSLFQ